MTTDSSQTASKSVGRLCARDSAEPTAVITKPRVRTFLRDEDVRTLVESESRLAVLASSMTRDELDTEGPRALPSALDAQSANETTSVDSQVADRIAAELAIARREADSKEPKPREPKRASRLGKYGLMSYLASGRTSHVYLARLDGPAGFVGHLVVKILRARHVQDPKRVAAFFEIARLFSTFHHDSIAQVFEVGVDSDTHYVVMDHLHGMPLRTALERRPGGLPLDFAIAAIASCAEALHYARSKQTSHDHRYLGITPSYVMACADGSVKLFHLGPTGDPTPTLTSRELAYLSPEHARGEAGDASSEVFALGVMLYELTTGVHPYLDPSSEPTCRSARDRLVYAELQPPAKRFPHFPPELSDVVMTALARDPDSRYRDGRVFGQALLEVAQHLSLRPGPLAVRQLVSQLLDVQPAEETRPAPLSYRTAGTDAPTAALEPSPAAEPRCHPVSYPVSQPVSQRISQPVSHSPAWAGLLPPGSGTTLQRLRARGTSPLQVFSGASPMRTDEWPPASPAQRATTLSCRPFHRQDMLRRALVALVLISVAVTLAGLIMLAMGPSAQPVTTTIPAHGEERVPAGRGN